MRIFVLILSIALCTFPSRAFSSDEGANFLSPDGNFQLVVYDKFSVANCLFQDAVEKVELTDFLKDFPEWTWKVLPDSLKEKLEENIKKALPPLRSIKTVLNNKTGVSLVYTSLDNFSSSIGISENKIYIKDRISNISTLPVVDFSLSMKTKKQYPHSVGFKWTARVEKALTTGKEDFINYLLNINVNKTIAPITLSLNIGTQRAGQNHSHYNFHSFSVSPCLYFNVNHQIILGGGINASYTGSIESREKTFVDSETPLKCRQLLKEDQFDAKLFCSLLWKIHTKYWLQADIKNSLFGRNDMTGSIQLLYNF